ncbi:MAG: hypothetical protein IIY88_02025 [Eubacterium sp.]|nr:hypothetical protein [Eubacterium sp.]
MKGFGKVLVIFGGIIAAGVALMGLVRHGLGEGSIILLKDAAIIAAAGLALIVLRTVIEAMKDAVPVNINSGSTVRTNIEPSLSDLETRFGKSDMVQDILSCISDKETYCINIEKSVIRVLSHKGADPAKEFYLSRYNYESLDFDTIDLLARYLGSKFPMGYLTEDITEVSVAAGYSGMSKQSYTVGGTNVEGYFPNHGSVSRSVVGKRVINGAFEREYKEEKQKGVKRKL